MLPYLKQFVTLEWHLGRPALATDDASNTLRIHLDWSLDELIGVYLGDNAPDTFELRQEDVWLEIRGSRGTLTLTRVRRR